MIKSDVSTTPIMDLADFLAIPLLEKNGKVTGKNTILQNWGLTTIQVKQNIFASYADSEEDGWWSLLIACSGNLGLMVDYDIITGMVEVNVVDRSLIPDRGKIELKGGVSKGASQIPPESIKATFVGQIKKVMTKVD